AGAGQRDRADRLVVLQARGGELGAGEGERLAEGLAGVVGRDGQRRRCDVGLQPGRLRQGVVTGLGAAEAQVGDADGDAGADVPGGEGRGVTAAVQADVVVVEDALEPGAADVEGRRRRAVVHLAAGRDARYGQG